MRFHLRHKWGEWYRGLQALIDEPSMIETRDCTVKGCTKYQQRKVWLQV